MKQKFRDLVRHFFLIDDSSHKVAAGAALGLFMGIVPGGILTALFLATIFRFNRLATGLSAAAFSFWSTALALPLAAWIGGLLFGISPQKVSDDFQQMQKMSLDTFLSQKFLPIFIDISLPLITGLFVVATVISLGFYYLIYRLLENNKVRFK